MSDEVTVRARSRRDRGMTALIEGFFGFVWFGWGQANASAGLRGWLAVAGVVAAVVALAAARAEEQIPQLSSADRPV